MKKTTFDGGMKEMWIEVEGNMGKQVNKIDKRIATLRAQSGKMVSRANGKREVP